MKALDTLKADHQKVKSLFRECEKVPDLEVARKRALYQQIQSELSVHADVEDKIFYPAVGELPGEAVKDLILEAGEEHALVKTLLADLASIDPDDPIFDAKMKVLRENVEHHIEVEERDIFPLAKKLGRERLREVSDEMALVKRLSGRAA